MSNTQDVNLQNSPNKNQPLTKLIFRYAKEIFLISLAFCGFAAFISAFTEMLSSGENHVIKAQFWIFVTAMIFATYYTLVDNFFEENQRREVIRDTVSAIIVFAVFLLAGASDLIPGLDEDEKEAIMLVVGSVVAASSAVIICLGIAAIFKLCWKYLLEPQLLGRVS